MWQLALAKGITESNCARAGLLWFVPAGESKTEIGIELSGQRLVVLRLRRGKKSGFGDL